MIVGDDRLSFGEQPKLLPRSSRYISLPVNNGPIVGIITLFAYRS